MCLALHGTVRALKKEGGIPVALVRVPGGPERWCGVFTTGVEVGSAVLLHSGYVIDVLDPERAAAAAGLLPGPRPGRADAAVRPRGGPSTRAGGGTVHRSTALTMS